MPAVRVMAWQPGFRRWLLWAPQPGPCGSASRSSHCVEGLRCMSQEALQLTEGCKHGATLRCAARVCRHRGAKDYL